MAQTSTARWLDRPWIGLCRSNCLGIVLCQRVPIFTCSHRHSDGHEYFYAHRLCYLNENPNEHLDTYCKTKQYTKQDSFSNLYSRACFQPGRATTFNHAVLLSGSRL